MSLPPSPSRGVVALIPSSPPWPGAAAAADWQPILHASNQVVLYNARSHALSVSRSPSHFRQSSVAPSSSTAAETHHHHHQASCPYCKQPLPPGYRGPDDASGSGLSDVEDGDEEGEGGEVQDPAYHYRASDYFRLLAIANETSSRAPSPSRLGGAIGREPVGGGRAPKPAFPAETMAEGYFKTFFQEEYKLGMGANGSVFLCQHMLDGNPLGHFAVKKIAVGESHSYLLKILREVRLLERLHHPNIITYHHAWLETAQFSSFGPKVPTLHVLMQWAEGGSLDDFIDVRLGRKPQHIHINPLAPFSAGTPAPPSPSTASVSGSASPAPGLGAGMLGSGGEVHSRSARIRAFRAYQRAPPAEKERLRHLSPFPPSSSSAFPFPSSTSTSWTAVHLLSADEIHSLFQDIVEGLAFLHDRSILHLDLKPGNVLLTWDEGRLIPRAMLSDFGTSRDMINTTRVARSGNTGTLEYTSPESLPSPHTGLLQQIDSKADMWSLGMILHKLLFFKLPYRYAAEGDADETVPATGGARAGEESKLKRLEREVLEYPGFKSNHALQKAFDARRLPLAFLVLLESLLNKVPAGRPSVERVANAIREGKLDPLKEAPTDLDAASSELVPISRVRSGSGSQSKAMMEEIDMQTERTRLLGLPSPPIPEKKGEWGWVTTVRHFWLRNFSWRVRRRRRTWMRLGRSCLLVIKVLTIPYICPSESKPRLGLTTLLLGTAVTDTVVDLQNERKGLWVSVMLALVHIGVMRLGQAGLLGTWGCVPVEM